MSQKIYGMSKAVFRLSFLALVMFLLTFLVVTQVQAAKIGIDNFNSLGQVVCDSLSGCGVTASSVATADAIGGERDMVVVCDPTACGQSVNAQTGIAGDIVGYQQGTLTEGSWEMVWDGVDGDPNTLNATGLGGVDLTDGGTNVAFYLGDFTNDQAFTFKMEVYTDAANWSFVDLPQPAGQSNVLITIPFASFAVGGGTGVDFTSVGAVRVFVDGLAISALDVSFDYITVDEQVPTAITLQGISAGGNSPTLALIGAALLVLAGASFYFYRRQKQIHG